MQMLVEKRLRLLEKESTYKRINQTEKFMSITSNDLKKKEDAK